MILFVCSQAFIRSKTAAMAATLGGCMDAECVGTDSTALFRFNEENVAVAKVIYCMERVHKEKICDKFPQARDKCIILGITDDYERFNTDLVEILSRKIYQFDDVLSDQIRAGAELMYQRYPHYRKESDKTLGMSQTSLDHRSKLW